MEAVKGFLTGVAGIALFVLMFAIQCMVGVIPLMIGFWLWKQLF